MPLPLVQPSDITVAFGVALAKLGRGDVMQSNNLGREAQVESAPNSDAAYLRRIWHDER